MKNQIKSSLFKRFEDKLLSVQTGNYSHYELGCLFGTRERSHHIVYLESVLAAAGSNLYLKTAVVASISAWKAGAKVNKFDVENIDWAKLEKAFERQIKAQAFKGVG